MNKRDQKANRDAAIELLAEYLSGPTTGFMSIGLEVGGVHRETSKRFFALRDAFGVCGLDSAKDADRRIRETMAVAL